MPDRLQGHAETGWRPAPSCPSTRASAMRTHACTIPRGGGIEPGAWLSGSSAPIRQRGAGSRPSPLAATAMALPAPGVVALVDKPRASRFGPEVVAELARGSAASLEAAAGARPLRRRRRPARVRDLRRKDGSEVVDLVRRLERSLDRRAAHRAPPTLTAAARRSSRSSPRRPSSSSCRAPRPGRGCSRSHDDRFSAGPGRPARRAPFNLSVLAAGTRSAAPGCAELGTARPWQGDRVRDRGAREPSRSRSRPRATSSTAGHTRAWSSTRARHTGSR